MSSLMKTATSIAIAFLAAGCVAKMSVTKVDPNVAASGAKGLPYYLPRPYLEVTPKTDGSIDVAVVYLPDPHHQYVIDVDTFFTAHTIEVERTKEGFLDKIAFNGDATGVAKTLLEKTAELKTAEIEAQAETAKKDREKAEEDEKKRDEDLSAARQAVVDAQLQFDIATEKKNILEGLPEDRQPEDFTPRLIDLQLEEAEARERLAAAEAALEALVTANAANANAAANAGIEAPGPLFLAINMTRNGVSLQRATAQGVYETWKKPLKKEDNAPARWAWSHKAPFSSVVYKRTQGPVVGMRTVIIPSLIVLGFNDKTPPILNAAGASLDQDGDGAPDRASVSKANGGTEIIVDFPPHLSAGDYRVNITANWGDPQKPSPGQVALNVTITDPN